MESEALKRALEEKTNGRLGTVRDWLRAHPPDPQRLTQSLASVADRARNGEDFMIAVREFLDEYSLRDRPQRAAAIASDPKATGVARHDAFLGALAEHLALKDGDAAPAWSTTDDRFLDRFWFISDVPGFRAIAIAASPAAFRRRGIFVHPSALERV